MHFKKKKREDVEFKSVLIFILIAIILMSIFKMFSDMLKNSKKFYIFHTLVLMQKNN